MSDTYDKIEIKPIAPRDVGKGGYQGVYGASSIKPIPIPKLQEASGTVDTQKSFLAKAWENTKNLYTDTKKGIKDKRDAKRQAAWDKDIADYKKNYDYDKDAGSNATPYYRDTEDGRMYYKSQEDLDRRENMSYIAGEPVRVHGELNFKQRLQAINTKVKEWLPKGEKISEEQKKAYLLADRGVNPMSQPDFLAEQAQYTNYKPGELRGLLNKAAPNKGFFTKETRSF